MEKPIKTAKATRKVGSLTLGICLVGYGVLFLLQLWMPISYQLIFQLWPVLFILLGLEILFHSFLHKEELIRLDFFSCLMIFFSVLFATAMGFMDYGFQHNFIYFGW